ncbi:MAG: tRNA(Met) cytidine acetyltransferase [Alteromonadaceae bacterium]|jgi:tRNA(Met) cytidine acetyltransferase
MQDDFLTWLKNVESIALRQRQRKLIMLVGNSEWALSLLSSISSWPLDNDQQALSNQVTNNWQIYSDNKALVGTVNRQTYQYRLGSESQYMLFFADDFNIDAFAALSGTLIAGGICFIIFPARSERTFVGNNSAFLQRLANKITANNSHYILQQDVQKLPILSGKLAKVDKQTHLSDFPYACLTNEQSQSVDKIIKVVKGHRNRPLVLTADRGRGKSSALAIACAELLNGLNSQIQQNIDIVITAPHRQCLDIFFKQIQASIPNAVLIDHQVKHQNGTIRFMAVDQLMISDQAFTLVLVDEAAAIPVYLLTLLAQRYHRMVFASTVHGYEGAGRSFTLKFQKELAVICPQWQAFHIQQPIRWSSDDPLESFIFDSCLLDANLPLLTDQTKNSQAAALEFCEISTEQLIEDEHLLAQVFAVLVTAHYQTSPSDVQLLLDNEKISLLVLKAKDHIVAVALLIKEGKISDNDLSSIHVNKRRLKDQFIPQSLLTHCGIKQSFAFQYFRVMRIAVHPELHGKGIGQRLLTEIDSYALLKGVDFIGASFGCNAQLLKFWQYADYKLARIGFTRDKASGEYSALVLKSVNHNANHLLNTIEKEFYRSFDYLLSDEYRYLSTELIWQIMHYCPIEFLPKLTAQDIQSIDDFTTARRQYSCCVYGLHRWLLHQMAKPYTPTSAALIRKVLQKQSTKELCQQYNFTGKKDFNRYLLEWVVANV